MTNSNLTREQLEAEQTIDRKQIRNLWALAVGNALAAAQISAGRILTGNEFGEIIKKHMEIHDVWL